MKRTIFNRDGAYRAARFYLLCEAEEKDENLTDEELNYRIEKFVQELETETIAQNISKKLIELGWEGKINDGMSYRAGKDLAENFPKEMEQNLNEWLDNKPLTEIKYGGYSFKDMKNQYKNIDLPFFYYLSNMKEFILDGKKDSSTLSVGFRIL